MFTPIDRIDALFTTLANTRSRFGIWLLSAENLGKEELLALQCAATAENIAAYYLARLGAGACFASLSASRVAEAIVSLAEKKGDIRLFISNLDLLLSRLTTEERNIFWQNIFSGYPNRQRLVLFLLPASARTLLPQGQDAEDWEHAGKIIQ